MTKQLALAVFLCIPSLAAVAAGSPNILKVNFRTMDCDGATGVASVNVDSITRTQAYACADGRKLKQVLTRGPGGNEAYTIAEDEVPKLEAQIQRIMDARQKALENNKGIIIQH